ncbi:hypothetical protein Tco_0727386 [Tanacetum coccineum]|uniref:Uncharacterized protein n=1 Tax=Tanacetum coccineum TaxID=301880 RepID=A0ABQ4YIT8_9ASTR
MTDSHTGRRSRGFPQDPSNVVSSISYMQLFLYSTSPPSPPYYSSVTIEACLLSNVAAFLATLQPSYQPVTLVAACTLCGSLRSSLQPIWQPPQQPEPLWQPSQQLATYVAAFAAACNLCGSLYNSLHHMWHPPQQIESSIAAFTIACNLCGILHSSMQPFLQPMWQLSQPPTTSVAAFVVACNLRCSLEHLPQEKAPTESNLSNTSNDINIELSKEFLVELRKNIYHETYNEDMVDHIVKLKNGGLVRKSPLGKNLLKNSSVDSIPNHTMEKMKYWTRRKLGD